MSTEPKCTCPSCGNEFSGEMELCPVCMLRKGLAVGLSRRVFDGNRLAIRNEMRIASRLPLNTF